jgi:drug/metabolite transporter (DMT)-like permease
VNDLYGLPFGLAASLAWGLTDTAAAFASRRLGSLRVTAGAQLTSVSALAALMALSGGSLPGDPALVGVALACGVVAGLAYLAYYTALRHGPITVVSPMVSTYGGLTVVLSVLLLGEAPAALQAVGVGLATSGVVLASIAFGGSLRSARPVGPGVAYAAAALVAFAALTIVLAGPIRDVGWLPVIFLARIANATCVWTILGVTRLHHLPPPPPSPTAPASRRLDRRALALVVVAGLLDTCGFISFAAGLEVAPTWLIGITGSLGPVIAVTAGVLLFAERPRPVQWLGLGLVATSIFLIALG